MAAPKGHPRWGGRKKGSGDLLTADVRAMVLAALQAEGGVDYLRECARESRPAFMALLGRLMPVQATVNGQVAVTVDVNFAAQEVSLIDAAFSVLEQQFPKLIEPAENADGD